MTSIFFNHAGKEAIPLKNCVRFAPHGQTYHLVNDEVDGFFWEYKTDYFAITIFDFYLKKTLSYAYQLEDFSKYVAFSSHIMCANGEILPPYQQLSSNKSLVLFNQHQTLQTHLHQHSNYYAVNIDFTQKMVDEYLVGQYQLNQDEIFQIFQEANSFIGGRFGKIADEIINYKVSSIGSELFYEIKAKEWLSIIINDYYNRQNEKQINRDDNLALENVKHYINDHLTTTIPQDLLAKIAMMSKTKLKDSFKLKYNMTLTEYIQRRRMSLAEQLLTTTQLEIKEVAIAVGYHSHSRFSSLFKKYIGVYPHDIKKQTSFIQKRLPCDNCQNEICKSQKLAE